MLETSLILAKNLKMQQSVHFLCPNNRLIVQRYISSKHFADEFLVQKSSYSRGYLKPTAVPTLFVKSSIDDSKEFKRMYFSAINLKSVQDADNVQVRRSTRRILNEQNNQRDELNKFFVNSTEPEKECPKAEEVKVKEEDKVEKVQKHADKVPKVAKLLKVDKDKKDADKLKKVPSSKNLLRSILPSPPKLVKKDDSKKSSAKKSNSKESSSNDKSTSDSQPKEKKLSRKVKKQTAKIKMMRSVVTDIVKKNNFLIRNLTALLKKKNCIDADIMILLQKHMSNVQRLERKVHEKPWDTDCYYYLSEVYFHISTRERLLLQTMPIIVSTRGTYLFLK